MRTLALLTPLELIPLVIVLGGLALVIGARQQGRGLLFFAAVLIASPVLLAPLFDALPDAMLTLVTFAMLVMLALVLLRGFFHMTIGRDATNSMVGNLAAQFVVCMARTTWRCIRGLLHALRSAVQYLIRQ